MSQSTENRLVIQDRDHLEKLLKTLYNDLPKEGEQTEQEIRYRLIKDLCNADYTNLHAIKAGLRCHKCRKPMKNVEWCVLCGLEVCSNCMPPHTIEGLQKLIRMSIIEGRIPISGNASFTPELFDKIIKEAVEDKSL